MNQITPSDKQVYLTVKINLKLKVLADKSYAARDKETKLNTFRYIDLVLRKRISVSIYLPTGLLSAVTPKYGLSKLKNFLVGDSASHNKNVSSKLNGGSDDCATSVIYRIISSIPKCLTEIESRESLAEQAASSLANGESAGHLKLNHSNASELSQFEHYAKTIAAVDALLKQDRMQQQAAIKVASDIFFENKAVVNSSLLVDSQMKKTFSVPNMIKSVNRHFCVTLSEKIKLSYNKKFFIMVGLWKHNEFEHTQSEGIKRSQNSKYEFFPI